MPNTLQTVLGCALALTITLASPIALAAEPGFDDTTIEQIHYPDWFKDSFLDLPDDAAMAADASKQGLFLFFATQGCSYCHLFLEKSLGDPAIAARLREHFDAIGLEIFSDAELTDFAGNSTRVKAFAVAEGVEFAPTLLFYDTSGEPLLKLTGYYGPERFRQVLRYLIDGHDKEMSLHDYLQQHSGAAGNAAAAWSLPKDPLFEPPPYALARNRMPAERPLLVIFEGKDCGGCGRFHREVLGDDTIRERLAGFDVVRLDADDTTAPVLTPAGARTTPGDWYAELGFTQLPALAFFAENGRQVLTTDALVLQGRMQNSLGFVSERAYEKGWNYQRYARSQALARARAAE
ncbi:MAG: thioredoxin fold domain-containing protein [Thiohalocapsa sp.]|jgi:thioredoxin-related protein|uniref:thioredoxin fold domain-containing protein n=1 Tax=Thiohalocapsa sp. TaxID=2497641 RepID=UPI0026007DE6|nr:thioredoxin fold domain-containing protein [Thiohalocapsa sp.]MCG6943583.1 thioredoxin fold domain-containing protein [Thiohalocapsa sp.]